MAKFNIDDYKSVQVRINEFWAKYPTGSIETENVHYDTETGHVLFKATLKDNDGKIISTGYAEERREFEKQKNSFGKEVESVNFAAHVENCETSAIGRAIANAGFATTQKERPSREEMEKVQRMTKEKEEPPFVPDEVKPEQKVSLPDEDDFTPVFISKNTRVELQTAFTDFQKRVKAGEFEGVTYKSFMDKWRQPILEKLNQLK